MYFLTNSSLKNINNYQLKLVKFLVFICPYYLLVYCASLKLVPVITVQLFIDLHCHPLSFSYPEVLYAFIRYRGCLSNVDVVYLM